MISAAHKQLEKSLDALWTVSGRAGDNQPLQEFEIHSEVFTIGRRANCSLPISSSCVSSNHAELRIRAGRMFVADLNSTNGTFINGVKLQGEAELFHGDLVQFASMVFRVQHGQKINSGLTVTEQADDQALTMLQFDRLIHDDKLTPHFQPIVSMADQSVVGYEVLARSSLFRLQLPKDMFEAARQLGMEIELSQVARRRGIEVCTSLPASTVLFVNTHPKELADPRLHKSLEDLRILAGEERQITLEIHEAAVTNLQRMKELVRLLNDLNFRLAFDDFGVGQARLVELAELSPQYLKFDMKLTQNIQHASCGLKKLVNLFAKFVNDMGILALAEGVETEESHRILLEMGFHMAQGFYYGKPQPISKWHSSAAPDLPVTERVI
ncbi:MAG TPA: EAL domain-containing protein [Pirellulaceae bacterium]|nr:EAL domain-containing protein [Pirellulaceae bacterium]